MTKRIGPKKGRINKKGEYKRVQKGRKVLPPPKRVMKGRPFAIRFRVSAEEHHLVRYMAAARGYASLSEYLRSVVLLDSEIMRRNLDTPSP